jgi:hypothetical protein
VVYHLYACQPLDVSDAIPARSDQAHGEAIRRGQWFTVHFIAEQVVAVERFVERHAAGELLGDRQIKCAAGIGLDRSRLAAADDSRVIADCHRALIRPPEDHFGSLLQDTCLLQQRRQRPPTGHCRCRR